MNIVLWIVQVLLALAFFGAGFSKAFMPIEQLSTQMAWVADVNPLLMVRLPGIAEIVGALGLILPSATRIQPKLTVWAAYALALVMAMAAVFHLTRGETGEVIPTVVLLVLSLFVGYGRTKLAPIAPRE